MENTPTLDINDLQFVERAIKRTRRLNYIMGFVMLVISALFIAIPFLDPDANPASGGSITIISLGGVTAALGIFMIVKATRLSNIQDSAVYQTIMLEPKTITRLEVHIHRSAYTKRGSQTHVHLFSGEKKVAALTVSEAELSLLHQYLLRHNPNLKYSETEHLVR